MKRRNWLRVSFIYVGTVIGAGFASGREIIEFFGVYGLKGVTGITISGMLFALFGGLLLLKIYNHRIRGFDDLAYRAFGKKLGAILDVIMIISLYTGFSVMVSGGGTVFKEELGISFNSGIAIMTVLSFIVFLFRLKGFSLINSALVPILISGIIFTVFYLAIRDGHNFYSTNGINLTNKGNFFTSSLLYVGSNSLIIITVFSTLLPLIDCRKTAILGGIAGGTILYVLGLSILLLMLVYYRESMLMDIPMLIISNYISSGYRKFYAVVLWVAMFTTALANGSGFINRFSNSKHERVITAAFCIASIPLAKLGFARLIGILYPVFGLIGFLVLMRVLIVL